MELEESLAYNVPGVDNFAKAMLSMFQCVTLSAWSYMQACPPTLVLGWCRWIRLQLGRLCDMSESTVSGLFMYTYVLSNFKLSAYCSIEAWMTKAGGRAFCTYCWFSVWR